MFRKIEMGQRVLILRLSGNDIPSDKQKITPLTETGEFYSNYIYSMGNIMISTY